MRANDAEAAQPDSVRGKTVNLRRWAACSAILALLGVAALLQARVDRHAPERNELAGILYVPSGAFVKQTALGFDQAWADLLWIRTIGYYADQSTREGKFTYLYHMLDIVTTLDPRWLYPYLFGGVTLSLDLDRPDLANKLLRKAIPEHPDVWKIPFLIGFNAYFGLGDARTAARFIDKASKLPGAPVYLKGFASRLYVKGGSTERALQFLQEVINQTEDPALRERLVERYRQIQLGTLDGPYKNTQEGEAL